MIPGTRFIVQLFWFLFTYCLLRVITGLFTIRLLRWGFYRRRRRRRRFDCIWRE